MDDEDYIREKELSNQPKSIPLNVLTILADIGKTHICKIYCKDGSHGTGFFCNINDWKNNLKVLMTNNHVLNLEDIQPGKTIKLSINNDTYFKNLTIDKDRKTYTNELYDITVIEIRREDNIEGIDEKSFFEVDNRIFDDKVNEIYKNSHIYLFHYAKGLDMQFSTGIIRNISETKRTIYHLCDSAGGSSGGPIVNSDNFRVIGIHKGGAEKGKNYNLGTLLREPIEIIKEKMIINSNNTNDNDLFGNLKNSVYIKENEKESNIVNINKELILNLNDVDEITIGYKIDNIGTLKDIRIFGDDFVENNKNICKININGNDSELSANLNINSNQLKNNIFEIKLKGIKKVTDMSHIFHNCKLLSSLPDISDWNTQNIKNMSNLFDGCESLSSLPDISKWRTDNVTDMSSLFSYCISLSSLPDISKWNTEKVTNMSFMFWNCKSISTLPDISDWNTKNVTTMSHMFFNCVSLTSLPDITKWNTDNVTDFCFMFYNCKSLSELPDISKWNTTNVTDMLFMFCDCKSLSSLPDISSWNTQNVTDMRSMFFNCKYLTSLPDISSWNTQNVIDMSSMFWNCKSLSSLPDISKWNIQNVTDKSSMFEGCNQQFPKF